MDSIDSINVVIGTDTSIRAKLGDTDIAGNPFALLGFSPEQAEKAVAICQKAADILWSQAAETVRNAAPKIIPLYATAIKGRDEHFHQVHIPGKPEVYAFTSFNNADRVPSHTIGDDKKTVHILSYPKPIFYYIAFACAPQVVDEEPDFLRDTFLHELAHVLTHPVAASSPILSEAFAERLTKDLRSPRDDTELAYLPWHPQEFIGTCGLRLDDFADVARTEGLRNALRIAALNAFRDISTDELWNTESGLTATADLPRFEDVRAAFGKQADAALDDIAFRPMTQGNHFFLMPFGGNYTYIFGFHIKNNPKYLRLDADEYWSADQFLIKDINCDITYQAKTPSGTISMSSEVECGSIVSFHQQTERIEFITAQKTRAEDIESIHCCLDGITISLQQSEYRLKD